MRIASKILKWKVKGSTLAWDNVYKAEKGKNKILDNVRMASKC